MYAPAVARESTQTMTPCWNLNASVVVPCAILMRKSRVSPALGTSSSDVYLARNSAGCRAARQRREAGRRAIRQLSIQRNIRSRITD